MLINAYQRLVEAHTLPLVCCDVTSRMEKKNVFVQSDRAVSEWQNRAKETESAVSGANSVNTNIFRCVSFGFHLYLAVIVSRTAASISK